MPRQTWQLKFFAYFLLAALLFISLCSFGVYIKLRQTEIAPTFQILGQIADVKTIQLNEWFTSLKSDIVADLSNQNILDSANAVIKNRIKIKPEYQQAYSYLKKYFSQPNQQRQNVSILSNSGIVIFSTDSKREGQYQPLQNTTTYFTLDEIDNITPNFYQSSITKEPTITFGIPLVNHNQNRMGVLAIDLNLADLDQIIRQPIALPQEFLQSADNTMESYLVGKISVIANAFIANSHPDSVNSPKNTLDLIKSIDSRGISIALQSESGNDMYLNYNRIPVLGVYRWIPQYRFGLIVEIAQSEVFVKAQNYASRIFIGGLATTLIISSTYVFLVLLGKYF